MQTRFLVAYTLIALMVAALVAVAVYYRRKRIEQRRIWQGRSRRRDDI